MPSGNSFIVENVGDDAVKAAAKSDRIDVFAYVKDASDDTHLFLSTIERIPKTELAHLLAVNARNVTALHITEHQLWHELSKLDTPTVVRASKRIDLDALIAEARHLQDRYGDAIWNESDLGIALRRITDRDLTLDEATERYASLAAKRHNLSRMRNAAQAPAPAVASKPTVTTRPHGLPRYRCDYVIYADDQREALALAQAIAYAHFPDVDASERICEVGRAVDGKAALKRAYAGQPVIVWCAAPSLSKMLSQFGAHMTAAWDIAPTTADATMYANHVNIAIVDTGNHLTYNWTWNIVGHMSDTGGRCMDICLWNGSELNASVIGDDSPDASSLRLMHNLSALDACLADEHIPDSTKDKLLESYGTPIRDMLETAIARSNAAKGRNTDAIAGLCRSMEADRLVATIGPH